MGETAFMVIGGVLFVALGHWMYGNPEKAYPSWVSSNPDSQFFSKFFRAFAVVLIFGGAYAAVAGIASLVLPALIAIMLSLSAGVAAAWFLRPGVRTQTQAK